MTVKREITYRPFVIPCEHQLVKRAFSFFLIGKLLFRSRSQEGGIVPPSNGTLVLMNIVFLNQTITVLPST